LSKTPKPPTETEVGGDLMDTFYLAFGMLRQAIWKISPYTKKCMLYDKNSRGGNQ